MVRVYMDPGKYATRVWMGREKKKRIYRRVTKGENLLCMLTRGAEKKGREKRKIKKKNLGVIEF